MRWDDGKVRGCQLLYLLIGWEGKFGRFVVVYYSMGRVVNNIVNGDAPMVACR